MRSPPVQFTMTKSGSRQLSVVQDISQDARNLTETLNSITTVNQTVVELCVISKLENRVRQIRDFQLIKFCLMRVNVS